MHIKYRDDASISVQEANEYYPKLSFQHHPQAWVLRGDKW